MKRDPIRIDDPRYLAWKRQRDEQRLLQSFFPDDRALFHEPAEPHPLAALVPYAPFLTGAAIVLVMLLIITLLGGW